MTSYYFQNIFLSVGNFKFIKVLVDSKELKFIYDYQRRSKYAQPSFHKDRTKKVSSTHKNSWVGHSLLHVFIFNFYFSIYKTKSVVTVTNRITHFFNISY